MLTARFNEFKTAHKDMEIHLGCPNLSEQKEDARSSDELEIVQNICDNTNRNQNEG